MNANEYQLFAVRMLKPRSNPIERLMRAAVGLATEAGELLGLLDKHVYQDHPLDKHKAALELGDGLYYIAVEAHELGYSLTDIMTMNMDKLQLRYPSGEFTAADSIARRDVE